MGDDEDEGGGDEILDGAEIDDDIDLGPGEDDDDE
jgi:hypothetical protein